MNYKPSTKISTVVMLLDFNKNVIFAKGAVYPTYGEKRPHGWGKMPPV